MVERKRVGLVFTFDKEWLGGIIYIINLIKSANLLSDSTKPHIVLYYAPENVRFLAEIRAINYPSIKYIETRSKGSVLNYIRSLLSQQNYCIPTIKRDRLDGVFPANDLPISFSNGRTKMISWIPDFQHRIYPGFFTKTNLMLRELRFRLTLKNTNCLVLSSNTAYSHLKKFYSKNLPSVKVLQFASIISTELPVVEEVKSRYGISGNYFIVSNQFYEHKNHITVFSAVALIKAKHPHLRVIFTGKMEDHRNKEFIKSLTDYTQNHHLEEHCIFLGVIPREDQLALMTASIAVIQPSRFEGWSTVIEDAKALGRQVIASDIEVHREQLGESGFYFNTDSSDELAAIISRFLTGDIVRCDIDYNYKEHIKKFAEGFLSLFNEPQ